jgi:hypothetical protein
MPCSRAIFRIHLSALMDGIQRLPKNIMISVKMMLAMIDVASGK